MKKLFYCLLLIGQINPTFAITCNFSQDGKELTIIGSGNETFQNCDNGENGWKNKVERVVFGEGVSTIGENAFNSAKNLRSVDLNKVTTLQKDSFAQTGKLSSINMPNVTELQQGVFWKATALTNISAPSLVTIGKDAFHNSGVQNINIPNAVTIGEGAFKNSGIQNINIPNAVTIGKDAFRQADELTAINMPNVTSLSENAFYDTFSLANVVADNLQSIGKNAFANSGLESIYAPNVTYVGDGAFRENKNLTSVDFPNLETVDGSAFYNSNLSFLGCTGSYSVAGARQLNGTPLERTSEAIGHICSSSCGENKYLMRGLGCVTNCGANYIEQDGHCIQNSCDNGKVFYNNQCLDGYPFAKKRWTPAEAAQWLHDGNDNFVIITFKK